MTTLENERDRCQMTSMKQVVYYFRMLENEKFAISATQFLNSFSDDNIV